MRSRILLVLWLVVGWVAMWRDISVANIVSGTFVACLVVWMFPPARDSAIRVRPLALVRFVIATALSIVRANFVVAWEVVTPKNRINEGMVAVALASADPVVITLVSHAISLAPGSLVIDIERASDGGPTMLYVHVLHLRSVEHVRDEVLQLEKLALAAVAGYDHISSPDDTGAGSDGSEDR